MSGAGRACLALLVLLLALPSLTMAVWALRRDLVLTALDVLLTAALLAAAIAAATRAWRWFFLVQLPLWLLSVGFAGCALALGITPGEALAQVLAGASREEIRGFLAMNQHLWIPLAAVAVTLAYLALSWRLRRQRISGSGSSWPLATVLACATLATVCGVLDPERMAQAIQLNPAIGGVLFVADGIPRARAALHNPGVRKIPYQAHREGGEEVHILVIGESARRQSWSVYGYVRPTTPNLAAINSGLVLLQDAMADANLTGWSVPMILTGLPPDRFAPERIRGNLVDLAREAGYSTAWLVNQDLNVSRSVGIDPDLFVVPPDPDANVFGRTVLDGTLLPEYRQLLERRGSARFIGIHIMGAHWEYFRRYPPAFQRFGSAGSLQRLSSGSLFLRSAEKQAALVDAYDNATLYTDWFLQQVIDGARSLRVPATVLFYPDHGEDLQLLDGRTGHGLADFSPHAFEVPAFVWFNEAFRAAHPARVAALQDNATKTLRSHQVFQTEADLMGIRWPGADPHESFASAEFQPETTLPVVAGGALVRPR